MWSSNEELYVQCKVNYTVILYLIAYDETFKTCLKYKTISNVNAWYNNYLLKYIMYGDYFDAFLIFLAFF